MTYTPVSITGYNANPPSDDGTAASQNEVSWDKHKDKLGDPLKTAIEAIDTNVAAAFTASDARVPVGMVVPFAGAAAPTGYLLCDGSLISRTTYSDLFTIIGEVYNAGDSSTTFGVPDLEGRVIAGKEASATRLTSGVGGVDGATVGATGGGQSHQLVEGELPAHSHGVTDGGHTHGTGDAGQTYFFFLNQAPILETVEDTGAGAEGLNGSGHSADGATATGSSQAGITIDNAGSDTAHANVQPTMIMNYIIKT